MKNNNITNLTGIAVFLIFLFANSANAQQLYYEWAKRVGGTSGEQGNSIAVDALGNVYVTGMFNGTVNFNPAGAPTAYLTSAGNGDIFFAKYSASGNYLWAKRIGGITAVDDYVRSIAVDADGNVYITGSFAGTNIDFDPDPVNTANLTAGGRDVFFAKYDTDGNYVWAKKVGDPSGSDTGNSIALDAEGNIYITGAFMGANADFDPDPVNTVYLPAYNLGSYTDVFFAKYDNNGNYIWAKSVGSSGILTSDAGHSIAVDASRNVYITGIFYSTADFDPGAGTVNLTSVDAWDGPVSDAFFAKYNADGNYVWAKRAGGNAVSDVGNSIAVDALGNVYATGYFQGTNVNFNQGGTAVNLTSVGADDVFFVKYNTNGVCQWAKRAGGTGLDRGNCITLDPSGNIYLTGYFQGGPADFDPGASTANLTSAGSNDMFFAKYDNSGNYLWVKQMGGTGNDIASSLVIDASGTAYITGYFSATVDFDPGAGTANLASAGSSDVFFAKYTQKFTWYLDADGDGWSYADTEPIVSATSPGAGWTITVPAHGSGDCNDYNGAINPGATEICGNNVDENCDGITYCHPYDNPAANNPNLGNVSYVYPNVFNVQGTTAGATVTQQGIAPQTGKKDVWYQFTAISNGVSIKVTSTVIEPHIYLYSGTVGNLTQIDAETIVATNGPTKTAVLNYGGLTAGQTYRVAVGSATATDGAFTICLQQLRKAGCSVYNNITLCSSIGTTPTGAASTTYTFTGAGSASTSGLMLLSTPALLLAYGNSYPLSLTANYDLHDAAGLLETISVPNASACTLAVGTHTLMEVKSNQRCPATLFRSGYLLGTPSVCGATGYEIEFTPVSDCNGNDLEELETFTKTITGSSPSIYLSYAFGDLNPVSGYPYVGRWSVRWRPVFAGGSGTYGNAQVISVNSTSANQGMVLEPADNTNTAATVLTSNVSFDLYPNPNTGDMVNMNITGITSDNVFVRIMDSMGRVIYTNRYAVEGSLNTIVTFSKPLASGLYMVEFTSGGEVMTQRMMVAK